MKTGDKVLCIKKPNGVGRMDQYLAKRPEVGEIYTIRNFTECEGKTGIRLNEIINPILPYKYGDDEIAFNIRNFMKWNPEEEEIVIREKEEVKI